MQGTTPTSPLSPLSGRFRCRALITPSASGILFGNVASVFSERIARPNSEQTMLELKHGMHPVPVEQQQLGRRPQDGGPATLFVRCRPALHLPAGDRGEHSQSGRAHAEKHEGNRLYLHER